jgi:simple sugar transport system ATP-binding protein
VGSIEFVHQRIVAERDHGTPVVIVSTELDEVLALADRIAVMYRGKIIGIVPAGTARDVLGLMMAGASAQDAEHEAARHRTALAEADAQAEQAAASTAPTAATATPVAPAAPVATATTTPRADAGTAADQETL